MQNEKQKLTFVIPVYRPELRSFDGLLTALDGQRIILIDNSGDIGKIKHPDITVYGDGNNTGFAAGVNLGLSRAIKAGADWIVIANQDLRVGRNSIRNFRQFLLEFPPGITGPFGGGLDSKRWSTIYPISGPGNTPVRYISGSCMALHRSVIAKIGYFHAPYFMYYEDADYCHRAAKSGFPVSLYLDSGFRHSDSAGLGSNTRLHSYYLSRNHLLFVKRNAPASVYLHEIIRLPKTLTEHAGRGETGALEGIRDYALGRFGKFGGIV